MIIQNPLFLAGAILSVPLLYNAYISETFRGKFTSLSYVLIVLTLVVAAAGPQIQQDNATVKEERLVFLNDKSASVLAEEPELDFQEIKVEERTIASGNSSRIEQSLNALVESNTTYLVHSDLQDDTDFSGVEETFKQQDSQLNFYKESMKRESSIFISGPSTAVPNSDNTFNVELESTVDDSQMPQVTVDGQEINLEETEQEGVFEFSYEFSDTGTHRIKASLTDEDVYASNNDFYKTVKVIERPEVLIIGQKGSLGGKISDYFDITYSNTIPEDLSQYYSVVLKEKIDYGQKLEDYIYDGNGLVYTGEGTMDILPTKKHDYSQSIQNPRIILGMDISGSIGEKTTKQSQNLTSEFIGLLSQERPETIVGVFAYNRTSYTFGEPQPLSIDSYARKLTGLRGIETSGTAYHINALEASKNLIGVSPGNIILISDFKPPKNGGITTPSIEEQNQMLDQGLTLSDTIPSDSEYEQEYINRIQELPSNITFHAVGVGDANTDFIKKLNDLYSDNIKGYNANNNQDLNSLINQLEGGGGSDRKGIGIVDANHFITDGLGSLSSTVTDIEEMKARPGARTLVQTSDDRAFLSAWRYGLGRVAAFSGDGRNLENVMGQEPILFSRTLNWAVGNPERKNNRTVNVETARMGEDVTLEASYSADGFVRVGENRYRASAQPSEAGFHDYYGNVFAYNYGSEIQSLGYREDIIDKLASATGGEVYEGSVEGIEENIKSREVESVKTVSLTPYLIVLALLVFLVQVGYRKSKGWM